MHGVGGCQAEVDKTKDDNILADSLAEDTNTKEKDVFQDELDNFI